MSVEPGWYYAEGDPAGTVRRWNGEAWIGFPIVQPGMQTAQATAADTFVPKAGQVSLKATAIIAQICLVLLALASIAVAIMYFRIGGTDEGTGGIPADLENQFGFINLLFFANAVLAALSFVAWFTFAYRNISLWTQTRRSLFWTFLAWIIPFINLVRPMSMMLELVEHSPRPDRRGELSPTPVILWWFLWMLPGIAGGLVAINIARQDLSAVTKGLFVIQGSVTVLNTISIIIAIYLVQAITDSQERRLR